MIIDNDGDFDDGNHDGDNKDGDHDCNDSDHDCDHLIKMVIFMMVMIKRRQ